MSQDLACNGANPVRRNEQWNAMCARLERQRLDAMLQSAFSAGLQGEGRVQSLAGPGAAAASTRMDLRPPRSRPLSEILPSVHAITAHRRPINDSFGQITTVASNQRPQSGAAHQTALSAHLQATQAICNRKEQNSVKKDIKNYYSQINQVNQRAPARCRRRICVRHRMPMTRIA